MSKVSDQVAAAKARAAEVVGGFKRVREQSARDVLTLAAIIEAQGRLIAELQQQLALRAEPVRDAEPHDTRRPGAADPAFKDIFKDIFGESNVFSTKR